MKFVWVPSISRYRRTETEVKKEKLAYEVVERETDKDSLIDIFNAYEERIEALQDQLRGASSPQPPAEVPSEPAPTVSPPQPAPVAPPTPSAVLDLRLETFERMNATDLAPIIETAVGRLGELGEEGFEALEGEMERDGVGGSFSRGVHILSCVAAGPHQLTRMLFRSRKAKKWA